MWQIKQSTENILITMEMLFWRRSAHNSKIDGVRNDGIREIMGGRHKTKQLIWNGHVQKMTNDRPPKQRGRPRRSWSEEIDKEIENCQKIYQQNRDAWRLGVRTRRRTL